MRTSRRSGKSSRTIRPKFGPFEPATWRKASSIVAGYRLILEPDERLGYISSSIEMPTVFADGRTPDACVKAAREALTVAVAAMLERGATPPTSRSKRSVQINIRLTPDEKLVLEEAAARMGFKALSDLVRSAALQRTASS